MTKNYLVQKVSDAEVEKPCFRTESLIFGGITATSPLPALMPVCTLGDHVQIIGGPASQSVCTCSWGAGSF